MEITYSRSLVFEANPELYSSKVQVSREHVHKTIIKSIKIK